MRAETATLATMAKKNAETKPEPVQPEPNRKARIHVNFRVEQEFKDRFDAALPGLVPDTTEASFFRTMMRALVLEPEGFMETVRRFINQHADDEDA